MSNTDQPDHQHEPNPQRGGHHEWGDRVAQPPARWGSNWFAQLNPANFPHGAFAGNQQANGTDAEAAHRDVGLIGQDDDDDNRSDCDCASPDDYDEGADPDCPEIVEDEPGYVKVMHGAFHMGMRCTNRHRHHHGVLPSPWSTRSNSPDSMVAEPASPIKSVTSSCFISSGSPSPPLARSELMTESGMMAGMGHLFADPQLAPPYSMEASFSSEGSLDEFEALHAQVQPQRYFRMSW